MKQRGRRGSAELSVVVDVRRQPPMRPPSGLSDAQATVWRDVAGCMPGNWLTKASAPVLVEFCRHVCRARLLEALVAQFEPEWIKADGGLARLDKLLAMAERETRAATACARALRLTPQSQMHARTAARRAGDAPTGPRPWDYD